MSAQILQWNLKERVLLFGLLHCVREDAMAGLINKHSIITRRCNSF